MVDLIEKQRLQFLPGLAPKLGFYVYALRDPRDGTVFYVGKGRGNRAYQHARAAVKSGDSRSLKLQRIKQIHAAGREVMVEIVRYGITDEKTAFLVEAVTIDALTFAGKADLSHQIAGHGDRWSSLEELRHLPREKQFGKYDIIRVRVRRPTSGDTRRESFTPIIDSIEKIDHLDAKRGWASRIPYIEQVRVESMCALQRRQREDGTSLGVFRPAEFTNFEITSTSPEWDAARQAMLGQGNLLAAAARVPLEKIPFDFHYSFVCDDGACNGHRMSMIDWELGQNYRRLGGWRRSGSNC